MLMCPHPPRADESPLTERRSTMAQPVVPPTSGGSNDKYLDLIAKQNEDMKAFNFGLTMLEMDMKKNNNAWRAVQGGIQGMPA